MVASAVVHPDGLRWLWGGVLDVPTYDCAAALHSRLAHRALAD